jgi:hypothetical protein
MNGVIYPFTPTYREKEQLFVRSVSFDAACILAAFDLPQLLIGSPCLALRWRSLTAFNSIDKLQNEN